jgi:hypothetical protein
MLHVAHCIIPYKYHYLTHKIPKHNDVSFGQHEFKNFTAFATKLLHLQQFTNSHFHFLIIVASEASEYCLSDQENRAGGP